MTRVEKTSASGEAGLMSSADPHNVLMTQLSDTKKPKRARSAQQQWQKENWRAGLMIETTVLMEWEAEASRRLVTDDVVEEGENTFDGELTYPPIDFVTEVTTRLFKALPAEEQAHWKQEAQEEARVMKEEYEERMGNPLENADAVSRAT